MKRTRAELAIIQALCPGPGLLAATVVRPAGVAPFASFKAMAGSVLLKYASMVARRCSVVGTGAAGAGASAGGVAAGAASCAITGRAARNSAVKSSRVRERIMRGVVG